MTLRSQLLTAMASFTLVGLALAAQPSDYPKPRFPNFVPSVVTDQNLLDAARIVVKRPGGDRGHPGYAIKRGESALMVVSPFEDPRIVDALAQAIREAGATVDIFMADMSDITGPTTGDRDWGYLEFPFFQYMRVEGRALSRLLGGGQWVEKTLALAELKNYNLLIANYDGYLPKPVVARFRWEGMPGPSVDEFIVAATFKRDLPRAVADKIDELAWKQIQHARRVHVTDPEGTDVRWNLPAWIEQIDKPASYWRGEHLCMPDYMRLAPMQTSKTYQEVDMTGVVAGTINHIGAFPRIQVFLRGGRIERIEGGGKYGDAWRRALAMYESASWPHQPGSGYGWIQECGLGLEPSAFRPRGSMKIPGGPMNERLRTGVMHWAFGVQSMRMQSTEARQYIIDNHIPDGHVDLHNKFLTMTLEMADGKEILFVDKGRLTVLDDPQVREVAARFGEPDAYLQDAWVPPVPGINVPGNYLKDYATDPVAWITKEYDKFFKPAQGAH